MNKRLPKFLLKSFFLTILAVFFLNKSSKGHQGDTIKNKLYYGVGLFGAKIEPNLGYDEYDVDFINGWRPVFSIGYQTNVFNKKWYMDASVNMGWNRTNLLRTSDTRGTLERAHISNLFHIGPSIVVHRSMEYFTIGFGYTLNYLNGGRLNKPGFVGPIPLVDEKGNLNWEKHWEHGYRFEINYKINPVLKLKFYYQKQPAVRLLPLKGANIDRLNDGVFTPFTQIGLILNKLL
jgi:hypothetical protein